MAPAPARWLDGGAERSARYEETRQRRRDDDERERDGEEEDADECGRGYAHQEARLQRALANPDERLDDDDEYRRLDSVERAFDGGDAATHGVEDAEREHHQRPRQHEQDAGGEPAARAVKQPPHIGGELLRLRAWQQDAEVERVEEALLVDPFALIDEHAMHDRDLACRSTEADEAELEPEAERLAKGDVFVHCRGQALLFHIWGPWRKGCSAYSSSISSSGASSC